LYNFPMNTFVANASVEQRNAWLKEAISHPMADMDYDSDPCDCGECNSDDNPTSASEVSMLIDAILTKEQRGVWHDVLITQGFEHIRDFKNSNTGNTLSFYLLATNQ
jgi:hypothetical protein